jgi:putative spermidine/putrescine transport system permease protein
MKLKVKNINRYLFHLLLFIIYGFLLAPIIIVVISAFDPAYTFTFPPRGITFKWFLSFFTNTTFMTSFFKVSLPLAIAAALISTPLGLLGSWGLVRYNFKGKNILETFFILPMLVPEVLMGIALLLFFIKLEIKATFIALTIGHIILTIPYTVRTITASLHGMDKSLEEAAMILGATKLQSFLKITLPLIRSGIISGALFCFMISFGNINFTLFLTGPETATIPIHIYSEIQWQGDPTIAAISTIQIMVIGLILLIVNRAFGIRFAM